MLLAVALVVVLALSSVRGTRATGGGGEVRRARAGRGDRRVPPGSPPQVDGWSFEFVLRPANASGDVALLGTEYFSQQELRVRRDWSVGDEAYGDSPLPRQAGGSELVNVDLSVEGSQHVLYLATGVWHCEERPIPVGTPTPQGGLLRQGTRGGNVTLHGRPCYLLLGQGLNRPGPSCSVAPYNWTAWVAWDDGSLQQLQTGCFVLEVMGWRGPPSRQAGSQYGPLSVPLVCPVDTAPGALGYTMAAGFVALLLFGMITVRHR